MENICTKMLTILEIKEMYLKRSFNFSSIKLLMRVEGNRIGGRNNFGGKCCNIFYKTKSPNALTLIILP